MLTQLELDSMQMKIQNGEIPEIYFVAHYVECREGIIDAEQYKSVPRFKVIKIKISEIQNAYFELLNYRNNGGINGEKYQSLTFTLCIIYIPLLFFSIVGLAVNHYGTTNEILNTIFSEKIMKFFYPTRVLVIK